MISLTLSNEPGKVLYLYPPTQSLADYTTSPARAEAIERGAPDTGLYDVTVDEATYGMEWAVFEGASQPSDWSEQLGYNVDLYLESIKVKLDSMGTGIVVITAPVSVSGVLEELVLGDDYLTSNGRALEWTFPAIAGFTTSATGKLGLRSDCNNELILTNGVVTDVGGGDWKVTFDVLGTDTENLTPGNYDWSVEITQGGVEVTIAKNTMVRTMTRMVEKQTEPCPT